MKRRDTKSRVLISSSRRAVRVDREALARLVEFVAGAEGRRLGQIDLAVVGRGEITALNRRWLGHSRATDVLSFDLGDACGPRAAARGAGKAGRGAAGPAGGLSGQIIVCGEVAAEQARLRGISAREELMLYVVHGLLHLMDYDDRTVRGAAAMHAREDDLLREFISQRSGRAQIRNPKSEIRNRNRRA